MAFNADTLPDSPEVDSGSCQLLGTTALIVQALMGVVVLASLVYKRHREPVKRPWRVWLFDVSKQIIGQAFVHGVNVLLSGLGATARAGNACVYYFLNILVDTTLGVALLYAVLHALSYLFTDALRMKGFATGQYGAPPRAGYWARQTAVYVAALTTMKGAVIGLFFLFPGLFKLGEWALAWLHDARAQVIVTMGVFPILMNVLQFWLIDSIVKASAAPPALNTPADEEHAPLFHHEYEEDEDEARARDDAEAQSPRVPAPPAKESAAAAAGGARAGKPEERAPGAAPAAPALADGPRAQQP